MRLGFLKENGEYSFARVVGFMLVIFWMVFAGKIALATNVISDMPFGIITLVLLAYGINKTAEVMVANGNSKTSLSNKEGG
jgi:hypothetical protein